MKISLPNPKVAFRVLLILLLLWGTVTISITRTTLLCIVCLALSYIKSWMSKTSYRHWPLFHPPAQANLQDNPFKGKTGPGYLTEEKKADIDHTVADLVTYDADNVTSLQRFKVLKNKTECIFAKRSRVWGSPDYDETLSLEENIQRLIPTFLKFTMAFQDLGLDAFLIELPGSLYGDSIETFGDAVRRVLLTMRKVDASRQSKVLIRKYEHIDKDALSNHLRYLTEDPQKWNRRSWVFQFNNFTFFITTFAPFYPESNSRFAFGCENCYILFQPELSFAIHDLPPDTAETNWTCPVTVRDKIRVAFREAGREYEVPMKLQEPMVQEIVKKIYPHDDNIQWWLPALKRDGKDQK